MYLKRGSTISTKKNLNKSCGEKFLLLCNKCLSYPLAGKPDGEKTKVRAPKEGSTRVVARSSTNSQLPNTSMLKMFAHPKHFASQKQTEKHPFRNQTRTIGHIHYKAQEYQGKLKQLLINKEE
jgi:hypothetical protein